MSDTARVPAVPCPTETLHARTTCLPNTCSLGVRAQTEDESHIALTTLIRAKPQ